VRITREAATRPQGACVVDDRVKGRADVRIFEQSTDSHPDYIVDALVAGEGERSEEAVFALREPQRERLQRLFWRGLHQCTMTEKKR